MNNALSKSSVQRTWEWKNLSPKINGVAISTFFCHGRGCFHPNCGRMAKIIWSIDILNKIKHCLYLNKFKYTPSKITKKEKKACSPCHTRGTTYITLHAIASKSSKPCLLLNILIILHKCHRKVPLLLRDVRLRED